MGKVDDVRRLRETRAARKNSARRPAPRSAKLERPAKPAKAAKTTAFKPRVGRPRIEDRDKTLAATKPWDKLKMSRASWYRRQQEQKEASASR